MQFTGLLRDETEGNLVGVATACRALCSCKVVFLGRVFLCRILSTMASLHTLHYKRISRNIWAYLMMWQQFFMPYNVISFWRDDLRTEAELYVTSSAASSLGFSIYFRGHWCAEDWSDAWANERITRDLTFLEFSPIWVAIWIWGKDMANQRSVVHATNSLSSKSINVSCLLCAFILCCMEFNLHLMARHAPRVDNGLLTILQTDGDISLVGPNNQLGTSSLSPEVW